MVVRNASKNLTFDWSTKAASAIKTNSDGSKKLKADTPAAPPTLQ